MSGDGITVGDRPKISRRRIRCPGKQERWQKGEWILAEIYEWIKRMIYLTIFLTLLLQILPKGSYRKYVKFFAGLVFVITVLNPLMGILQQENWEEELLNGLLYEESVREGELDFAYMEEQQKEYYAKSMGVAVREMAEQAADDVGVEIIDVEVENSEDDGTLQSVTVRVDAPSDILMRDLKERLTELLSLNDSQVEVREG